MITDARRLHMQIGPGSLPFTIHGDNGSGEYRSEQNISAFASMNATLTTCPPYTPAKNGAAERSWGIIIPGANCLMASVPGTFPSSLWCYAVNLSAHVANLTPVHSLGYKSPYEMLALATGKAIAIAAVPMYKFGAAVIMHLEPQNRDTGPRSSGPGVGVGRNSELVRFTVPGEIQ